MRAIGDSGKDGLRFSTVFLESCKSELPQNILRQFRDKHQNVGRVFTSNISGLQYRTIDYSRLFSDQATGSFSTSFKDALSEIASLHLREGTFGEDSQQRPFSIIAHRGASGYLPEHTLPAYALAYGMGVDYIGMDVVLTSDDQPIVLHDINLDTVTNVAELFSDRKRDDGRFYAIDFTLEEIRTLSVHQRVSHDSAPVLQGDRFPKGKLAFQIPTLREAIELVQGINRASGRNVGIYTEIRKPLWHRNQGKDISQVVLTTLMERGYKTKKDSVYLQCFDPAELRRIREELSCKLRLVQLIGNNDWNETDVDYNTLVTKDGLKSIAEYADGIGPWMPYVVKGRTSEGRLNRTDLVSMAHANELVVLPFTFRADALPNYAASFDELVRIFRNADVDGIFTNQPDQAIDAVTLQNASLPNASPSESHGLEQK